MLAEFVNRIVELSGIKTIKEGDVTYTDRDLHVVKRPMPEPIITHTLTGFVDYAKRGLYFRDMRKLDDKHGGVIIHIETPLEVSLLLPLEYPTLQRPKLLRAEADVPEFRFNTFHPLEEFIIAAQSKFQENDVLCDIVKVLGNVSDGLVRQFDDDGVTQKVTVNTGVSLNSEAPVPRVVELIPHRTFPEIEQVKSPFVLRLRSNSSGSPLVGMFEADGGAWRGEAIQRIKTYLTAELGETYPIIA